MAEDRKKVWEKMKINFSITDLEKGNGRDSSESMTRGGACMLIAVLTFMADCPAAIPLYRSWLDKETAGLDTGYLSFLKAYEDSNYAQFARTIIEGQPELRRFWEEYEKKVGSDGGT